MHSGYNKIFENLNIKENICSSLQKIRFYHILQKRDSADDIYDTC